MPPPRWRAAWRVAFAVTWLGVQVALVLDDRRGEGVLGFLAAPESSTLRMSLYREVRGENGQRLRLRVDDGVWSANDAGGLRRRFAWTDRVQRRDLAVFEREVRVRLGVRASLAALRAALDDVATHTADDADTRRFLLDVTVRRNGGEPWVVHLASAERASGGS